MYLVQTPELAQATVSGALTAIVQETLAACDPLEPRMVYQTDAGDAKGAQLILNLRSILLSGVWGPTYRAALQSRHASFARTLTSLTIPNHQRAA